MHARDTDKSMPKTFLSIKQELPGIILGTAATAVTELLIFHPVDTIAKRLMNNKTQLPRKLSEANKVIFPDLHDKSLLTRYRSLFPGLGCGVLYKVSTRVVKFGGQPLVGERLERAFEKNFGNVLGEKKSRIGAHAIAGSAMGAAEVAFLPLDAIKIKQQSGVYKGESAWQILRSCKFDLYKGAGVTVLRNIPGSFTLFGASAFVKENVFKVKDYKNLTIPQKVVVATTGVAASIIVTHPLDVIKTRIQAAKIPKTGVQIAREIFWEKGVQEFSKGLGTKLMSAGPKVVFTFLLAPEVIKLTNTALTKISNYKGSFFKRSNLPLPPANTALEVGQIEDATKANRPANK
jgi:hypothetical protein